MVKFQMVIKQNFVSCDVCQKPLPRSRLLFTASGIEFYITGAIGGNFDKVANVSINKMIEIGRRPSELRTVR